MHACAQRYKISRLKKISLNQSQIANEVEVDRSIILQATGWEQRLHERRPKLVEE